MRLKGKFWVNKEDLDCKYLLRWLKRSCWSHDWGKTAPAATRLLRQPQECLRWLFWPDRLTVGVKLKYGLVWCCCEVANNVADVPTSPQNRVS